MLKDYQNKILSEDDIIYFQRFGSPELTLCYISSIEKDKVILKNDYDMFFYDRKEFTIVSDTGEKETSIFLYLYDEFEIKEQIQEIEEIPRFIKNLSDVYNLQWQLNNLIDSEYEKVKNSLQAKKDFINEWNNIDKLKMFEIEVLNKVTNEKDFLSYDISLNPDTMEFNSNSYDNFNNNMLIDLNFSLDVNLQEFYSSLIENEILLLDDYSLI